jgi:hypothetical protein
MKRGGGETGLLPAQPLRQHDHRELILFGALKPEQNEAGRSPAFDRLGAQPS